MIQSLVEAAAAAEKVTKFCFDTNHPPEGVHLVGPAPEPEIVGPAQDFWRDGVYWFLDHLALIICAFVVLWLFRSGWLYYRKLKESLRKKRYEEGEKKTTRLQVFGKVLHWTLIENPWGLNATDGQIIVGAVTHLVFYYFDRWWAIPSKLEVNTVIAMSVFFATLLIPAVHFDVRTELGVAIVLTFMASSTFGAILATIVSDMTLAMRLGLHEAVGPSTLWNIFNLMVTGMAYWRCGAMSREAVLNWVISLLPARVHQVIITAKNRGEQVEVRKICALWYPTSFAEMQEFNNRLIKLAKRFTFPKTRKEYIKLMIMDVLECAINPSSHGGGHHAQHAIHVHAG